MKNYNEIRSLLEKHHSGQYEFHQAVLELYEDVWELYTKNLDYQASNVIERLLEPDRIISFRVSWEDDQGHIHVNRGWRIQYSNALGPYKGGLRFHPDVNQEVLKFLAFEQCFKNALTGLPMGGGKGGSNFDPKGKSKREIRRFCYAFMDEMHHYIHEHVDIPAGDIGVGVREISYLFGHYVKLSRRFASVLTGKDPRFGGSWGRQEATGYGCIYFLEHMLATYSEGLKGKRILISGSGNVALFAAEKAIAEKAKVLTLSDSSGFIYDKEGIDEEKLEWIKHLKFEQRGRISQYIDKYKSARFYSDRKPWIIPCDIALPCATQNEIQLEDAENLVKQGVYAVVEGANMPLNRDAVRLLRQRHILIGPAKAANAGGVAVSGLERTQNAQHLPWDKEKVDNKLQDIMKQIHKICADVIATEKGYRDYVKAANIAAFIRIADAFISHG